MNHPLQVTLKIAQFFTYIIYITPLCREKKERKKENGVNAILFRHFNFGL